MQSQLASLDRQLEEEELREKEEMEKTVQALQDERSKILAERKDKLHKKVKQATGDEDEHQKILQSHNEDTQKLVNKMDAEKLRMQAELQERLRKKRESKRKSKEAEMQEDLSKKMKEREEKERIERQNLAMEEKQKLEAIQESLEEDLASSLPSSSALENTKETREDAPKMAATTTLALPLSEQQLTSILLSTPLYQKLEQIRLLLQQQPIVPAPGSLQAVDAYIDPKDASWVNDSDFHPIDINTVPARAFVVYKFGCCIIESLVTHCSHSPVSLLLADRIPPNEQFSGNAFRNSFLYDQSNRILYMRLERLENVGEFVLVLIHTLSHIKSGSLCNDWEPAFVREFYHALSVCCSELFFARYRNSSRFSPANNSGASSTLNLLKVAFGEAETSSERLTIVDEVLDTRVMMGVDVEGKTFTHERIMERLKKYSQFSAGSELRSFLDQTEENINKENVKLTERKLTKESSTKMSSTAVRVKPEATRSLIIKARWQSAAKRARASLTVSPSSVVPPSSQSSHHQHFLQVQINSLRERVEKLRKEYTQVTKERMEVSANVQALKIDLEAQNEALKQLEDGSSEFEAQKQAVKNVTTRLSAAKIDLATHDLRVNGCLKRLEGFKKQLKQKQRALTEHLNTQAD